MTEREIPSLVTNPQRSEIVLFVLGKNIGVGWTGERIRKTHGHLSDHSRVSVLGAGEAMRRGLVDRVIFTITNTAGGEPLSEEDAVLSRDFEGVGKPMLSEAEYMRRKFVSIFPRFADRAHVQDRSWDTATDAKEARVIQDQELKPSDKAMLMTVGFHLSRAFNLFLSERVKLSKAISSDGLLTKSENPIVARLINNYRVRERRHLKEQIKETVAGGLMLFPPIKERISRKTKERMTKSKTA